MSRRRDFGYLILRGTVWSRLLHSFQREREREGRRGRRGGGRERARGERDVNERGLGSKLNFLAAPVFKVNLICPEKVPSRTTLPDVECFMKECLRGLPCRMPLGESGTAGSRLEQPWPSSRKPTPMCPLEKPQQSGQEDSSQPFPFYRVGL